MFSFSLAEEVCLIVVLLASITDIASRKIPNWLTLGGATVGIVTSFFLHGVGGLTTAIFGLLTGAALMLVAQLMPLLLRLYKELPIGLGDAKLFAAIGTFSSPAQVCLIFICFSFCFGLVFVFKVGWVTLLFIQQNFVQLTLHKPPHDSLGTQLKGILKLKIPLSPIIAFATFCIIFVEKLTGLSFNF